MSLETEFEKLQAIRAELEAESRLLIEKQEQLEKTVSALEEKVIIEELKKEQAVIEKLKKRNKATKDSIAQLAAKKIELETELKQTLKKPDVPLTEEEKTETVEEIEEERVEAVADGPEEVEKGGVIVTAIEGEGLIENEETATESPQKQDKKKRRFF